MNRLGALFGGMIMVVLAFGPGAAWAQPMPENSYQACRDGIDNDGNGYVDCNDAACAQFCQPQPQQVAPPPQYAPPPPQYQQQPPPNYPPPQQYAPPPSYPPPQYAPPPPPPNYYARPVYVVERPPRNGIAQIVTGFVLLPIGIIFVAVSAKLWNDGCGSPGSTCFDFPGSSDYDNASGALVLDLIGIPFIIAGIILIPVGFARYARYQEWKRRHGLAFYDKHGLTLEPVFGALRPLAAGAGPSLASQSLGLKLTF